VRVATKNTQRKNYMQADEDFGNNGIDAQAMLNEDEQINNQDFFEEEHQLFADRWREREWGDYKLGKTTKKKEKTNAKKRKRENNPSAKYGSDFNEDANPAYEDVHTPHQRLQVRAEFDDDGKKEQLKESLQKLVERRSNPQPDQHAKVGETLQEFMQRREGDDVVEKKTKDPNNYDWILSERRNVIVAPKKDVPLSADDEEEFVTTMALAEKPKTSWLKDRVRKSSDNEDAENSEKDEKDEKDEENEKDEKEKLMVRVSKKEIHYMQALTEKLYGKAVGEKEYVDEIAANVALQIESKPVKIAAESDQWVDEGTRLSANNEFSADLSIVPGFGEEDGNADDGGGFHVQKDWKTAHDAQSRKNLVPRVHWDRTFYGTHPADECFSVIDPYQFITDMQKKQTLMNDFLARVPFECTAQSILQSALTDAQKKTFTSFRQWGDCFEECDIVYYHSLTYTATYKVMEENIATMVEKKRLVVFHDLKNGFFVCNHFELVPKEKVKKQKNSSIALFSKDAAAGKTSNAGDHATETEKHNFMWIGYCYLQYVA